MEQSTPPIKPEIVITRTLPLKRQKSNFEQQLDSFKEELSVLQAQLDLFKTGLSSCQNQTNKDHKHIKKLNKGFGGFIGDQGRTNREIKTSLASLDSEQLNLNELIKMLAESATNLEERVKNFEQKNSIEQPQPLNIPKIVITPPSNQQSTVNKTLPPTRPRTSKTQCILDGLIKHKEKTDEKFKKVKNITNELSNLANEHSTTFDEQDKAFDILDTEQLRLNELITMLAENSTKLQNKLENNEKIAQLLCTARGEVETEIIELKNRTSNLENKINNNEENISLLQRELIVQNAMHEIEVQELKTTIEKQKQSMVSLTALILLWYYSNK
jgi:chromosome segregation ATPase